VLKSSESSAASGLATGAADVAGEAYRLPGDRRLAFIFGLLWCALPAE